jgi:hypothetical protein
MSKISLSFYGEEVYINPPSTLSDLQEQISSLFLLSKEDSKELILTYNDVDEKIFKIKTEEDYKIFLDKKRPKIILDVSQSSRIYKQELKEQEEIDKNKKKLNQLIKLEDEMEKPNKYEQEKINELNGLIKKYGCGAQALIKNIHSIHNVRNNKQQKIREEICQLQKKLGLPEKYEKVGSMRLKAKPKPKKETEEKKVDNKNNVHGEYICDGCEANPIVGIRYKCAVCDDFDFCEECEKKKGEEHNHPFLKIYEPKMTPISFKCFGQKQIS